MEFYYWLWSCHPQTPNYIFMLHCKFGLWSFACEASESALHFSRKIGHLQPYFLLVITCLYMYPRNCSKLFLTSAIVFAREC